MLIPRIKLVSRNYSRALSHISNSVGDVAHAVQQIRKVENAFRDGVTLEALPAIDVKVVIPKGVTQDVVDSLTTGCSVRVVGTLVSGRKPGQLEAKCSELELIGQCDESYPIQKKYHSAEYLRDVVHLRPRTTRMRSMLRVRSAASLAIHQYFTSQSFTLVNTPIITSLDCEGAGEQFRVTSHTKGPAPDTFFSGSPAMLTVSGQLHAELFATALTNVYTFGPTFRAEDSNTSRHLAEFWMVEPEMAFADQKQAIYSAESCIQHVIGHIVENCAEELEYFASQLQSNENGGSGEDLFKRIEKATSKPFMRISYTDALRELQSAKKDFGNFPLEWGCDLQSVHERYLADTLANGSPIVVEDYPSLLKPFYARENSDGSNTAAAFDILVPQVGELVGGSAREERLDILESKMNHSGMDMQSMQWYLDLRKYGTVPHAGWGMGFERLIQYVTGIHNIRDAIPIPRHPGKMLL